ncbi:MAG: GNAT family N-acetyltransferase [Promethearchaeota archaeon]
MQFPDEVRFIQEISLNAWPAKCILFFNGWILRISEGVTSRANSVLPVQYYGKNLTEDISLVEKIYKSHNLSLEFQITEKSAPKELTQKLTMLGYRKIKPSSVMNIKIKDLTKNEDNNLYRYICIEDESNVWFQFLTDIFNLSTTRIQGLKNIIGRIKWPQKVFVSAMKGKEIVGVVLGVLERRYLGIYELAVRPEFRRRGIASSLLQTLAQWGRTHQATKLYLQVQNDNTNALALYQKIGFQVLYNYYYLSLP